MPGDVHGRRTRSEDALMRCCLPVPAVPVAHPGGPGNMLIDGVILGGWNGWFGTYNGVVLLTVLALPVVVLLVVMRPRAWATVGLVYGTVPWIWMTMIPGGGAGVVPGRVSLIPFKDLLEMLAAEGKALLYISHVLETVAQVCNRVVVIGKGRVLADSPPEELKALKGLPSLESVFAQLVEQQDTRVTAERIIEVMRIAHG